MAIRQDLTPALRSAATKRINEAERLGDTFIGAKHTLLGMLAVEKAAARTILRAFGCDLNRLRSALEAIPDERPANADPNRLPMTKEMDRATQQAGKEASRLNSPLVGTEHLLLGLLAKRLGGLGSASAVSDMLSSEYGVTYRKVRQAVKERETEAA